MTRFARLLGILVVAIRYGLDGLLILRPTSAWRWISPGYWRRKGLPPPGVRLRRSMERLGPVFVKFGQLLSVRPDLIPADIAAELASLQDRVPAFPSQQALEIVERGFGQPAAEVFESFEAEPLASASIAQVHAAVLPSGREVAVKLVRPGVDAVIERDLALMASVARLIEWLAPGLRRMRLPEVVSEFDRIIHEELDMLREGANASQLRRNFADSGLLLVPAIEWRYCRENILVMDRVGGMAVNDVAALEAAGIDLKDLAERGVEIFFRQVFEHNFFHADMHPGNIRVCEPRVLPPGHRPQYIALDFGIMGSLNPADQRYLADNFLAFFNRDYRRVAELHVASGWVPPTTRVDAFEAAIRSVCEPIFQQPLAEISFGQLLVRLFQTARRFDMQVQPQLVLLQKTLLHIEGLGRQLYPDLDLWQTAKPFLERWMRDRQDPRRLAKAVALMLPQLGSVAADVTPLLPSVLSQAVSQYLATSSPTYSGSPWGGGAPSNEGAARTSVGPGVAADLGKEGGAPTGSLGPNRGSAGWWGWGLTGLGIGLLVFAVDDYFVAGVFFTGLGLGLSLGHLVSSRFHPRP